jgi:hypothetical protein
MKIESYLKYLLRFVLSNRKKKYALEVHGLESFSCNLQDIAVTSLLNGKSDGFYIEIGAQDPIKRSNTYALEKNFLWRGLSFELDQEYVDFFNWSRANTCIVGDATQHDYASLFEQHNAPTQIDYLQVDIDPPGASLDALKALPHQDYRFTFITFEHDTYAFGDDIAQKQRQFLLDHGYLLLAKNVMADQRAFEDWWIDPLSALPASIKTMPVIDGADYSEVVRQMRAHFISG